LFDVPRILTHRYRIPKRRPDQLVRRDRPKREQGRAPHSAAHSTCLRVATYRRSHRQRLRPADLTVTSLTGALPHNWTEQEKKFGVVFDRSQPTMGRPMAMVQEVYESNPAIRDACDASISGRSKPISPK
jgi:hypothetical protein